MDYFDLIINFFNVTDSSNLLKIHLERFKDNNEYKGQRIMSFIIFLILILLYISVIFGGISLMYYFLK